MKIDQNIIGVYLITNIVNNMIYVGSTSKSIKWRISNHITYLNKNKHHNKKLQNAWNQYGSSAFTFSILEETKQGIDISKREQFWMDKLGIYYPDRPN